MDRKDKILKKLIKDSKLFKVFFCMHTVNVYHDYKNKF